MAQNATMDMLELSIDVGGYSATGIGGGTPIRPTRSRAAMEMLVGIKGLGGFAKILDESGAFDIDIVQTSDDNAVFNRFHKLNMATPGGVGFSSSLVAPWLSLSCPVCFFVGEPDLGIGDTLGVFTWTVIGVQWRRDLFGKGATPTTTFSDLPELADIPSLPVPR